MSQNDEVQINFLLSRLKTRAIELIKKLEEEKPLDYITPFKRLVEEVLNGNYACFSEYDILDIALSLFNYSTIVNSEDKVFDISDSDEKIFVNIMRKLSYQKVKKELELNLAQDFGKIINKKKSHTYVIESAKALYFEAMNCENCIGYTGHISNMEEIIESDFYHEGKYLYKDNSFKCISKRDELGMYLHIFSREDDSAMNPILVIKSISCDYKSLDTCIYIDMIRLKESPLESVKYYVDGFEATEDDYNNKLRRFLNRNEPLKTMEDANGLLYKINARDAHPRNDLIYI